MASKQQHHEHVHIEKSSSSSSSSSSLSTSASVMSKNHAHSKSCISTSVKARAQEKDDLCHLNDRLAGYIERVRALEMHNGKLTAEIAEIEETKAREMAQMKSMYMSELSEARKLVDETSKEKALLKLETNKLNGIITDLRPKFEQELSSNKRISAKLLSIERSLVEKENLLATYLQEKMELETRVTSLELQIEDLETKLAADKDQLEKEIIARIDAENKFQTLREESQFQAQIYQRELSEARKASASSAISIDCNSDVDYEGMIRIKLQELREEFLCEAETGKQELEAAYRTRFQQLKEQADKDRSSISRLMAKQSDITKIVEELRSENSQLVSKYEHSEKHVQELNTLRIRDKEEFKTQLDESQATNFKLQGSYERLQSDYESLLGIKIQLDMELSAYNKLLEGEEQHFQLHGSSSSSSTSASTSSSSSSSTCAVAGGRASRKRKISSCAPSIETSATGSISFGDVDMGGKFVTITNTANEDVEMGGFSIQRMVNGSLASSFMFPCHYTLPAQQSFTVWGASHGMKANPPSEYVLDGDWSVGGESIGTSVLNCENKVIAQHLVTMSAGYTYEIQTRSKKYTTETCSFM